MLLFESFRQLSDSVAGIGADVKDRLLLLWCQAKLSDLQGVGLVTTPETYFRRLQAFQELVPLFRGFTLECQVGIARWLYVLNVLGAVLLFSNVSDQVVDDTAWSVSCRRDDRSHVKAQVILCDYLVDVDGDLGARDASLPFGSLVNLVVLAFYSLSRLRR